MIYGVPDYMLDEPYSEPYRCDDCGRVMTIADTHDDYCNRCLTIREDEGEEATAQMTTDAPWLEEPTHVEFEHAGLACVMHRKDATFHWCGYVGIPNGHPLHGVQHNQESAVLGAALEERKQHPIGDAPSFSVLLATLSGDLTASPDAVFEVHGGITWDDDHPATGNAETPAGFWWYGFDCAHSGDYTPWTDFDGHGPLGFERWRDMAYARRETQRLAEQLAALMPKEATG